MWEPPTRARSTAECTIGRRLTDRFAGDYLTGIDTLLASYRAIPPSATVRLAKRTSNLFRQRHADDAPGLDVCGLAGVLSIDVAGLHRRCRRDVHLRGPGGGHPAVRPGAAGGAATEDHHRRRRRHRRRHRVDSSFRSGLVFDDIVEMDVLTGAGEIVTATPDGEHADLFFGFANSYGTLGYATRLRVRLEPVKPFVALRHLRSRRLAGPAGTPSSRSSAAEPMTVSRSTISTASCSAVRELPDARHAHRRSGPDQRLHRAADLLPVDPATDHRPADHPRLPVAVGHRLVLVLPGLRRAAAVGPPALAETAAAQFVLLEAGRPGPPVRHRRPHRTAAPPAAAGAGGAGHRGPGRAALRTS